MTAGVEDWVTQAAPGGPCRPVFLEKPPGAWLLAPCTWRPLTRARRMPLVLVKVSFHGKRDRSPGTVCVPQEPPRGRLRAPGQAGSTLQRPRQPLATLGSGQYSPAPVRGHTPRQVPHSVALTLRPAALSPPRPGAETGQLRLSPTPRGAGHPATSSGPKLTRPGVMS